MPALRLCAISAILDLRERVLTPGHPGRPVVWPYDAGAEHYGWYVDNLIIACVSLTAQQMPSRPATHPHHLHSMAVEPEQQGRGVGRRMLTEIEAIVASRGGDLIWATARPSAIEFYERCGYDRGETLLIEPTKATMAYVWKEVVSLA